MVQDTLLAWYLMTKNDEEIPEDEFNDILVRGENIDIDRHLHIRDVYKQKGLDFKLTGKMLMSYILPIDFHYKACGIEIYKGVHLTGSITSKQLGRSHNAFAQLLYKEYGSKVCITFINNIQYFSYQWMCYHSFSVSLNDCLPQRGDEVEIRRTLARCFLEAKSMKQYHHPLIREAKVNETLNKARDIGMRIAKNSAQERNNFLDLIESGAKGNWFNIAQITSLLGQQNLLGRRIPGMLYKSRTLSAYPFEGLTLEEKYESRGFVRNSFIHGLNPKEFFFHMMAGREAVTDTSQKTSITGYTSHKLAKVLANLSVKYDGTVRDDSGKVVQFKYNDDGLDVTKCVMVDGVPQFCDVGRLVQKLNEE